MKMTRFFFIVFLSAYLFSCKKDNSKALPETLLYAKRGENAGIYDQQGRFVILRGVNYNALGDYWQGNPSVPTNKQYDEEDLKLMASYGVNCIRLLFSWSKLEPIRGQYNQEYINQLKTVIETAAKYNIYVILDMHQDAFSKFIFSTADENCQNPLNGWDGAPDWAVITDNQPTCMSTTGGVGGRESSRAVVHAWQNFWNNKNGIQDACVLAWKALVKETAQYANVVGYDLLNEPSLGFEPINIESDKLSKFYRKTINAIRVAEQEVNAFKHIMFFEMSVSWNGQGIPFIPAPEFTEDDNIVFAPHHYFESISYLLTIEQGLELLYGLSDAYKTATFISEFGFFGNPAADVEKYKRFAQKEDAYFSSSTWWQWAQAPGDPHAISWDGTQYENTSMHMIELDKNANFTGNKNEFYLKVLSRSRPNAIHGKPSKLASNPDDGTLELQANATTQGVTTLWIPDRFGKPKISGTNVVSNTLNKVEGAYQAAVKVNGNYLINVDF
jgi:endoglycosylceramidase